MQKVEPTSIYGRPIENIYISESIQYYYFDNKIICAIFAALKIRTICKAK